MGLVAAIVFVVVAGRFSDEARRRLLAIGLGVAAGVYVVFAVVSGGGQWVTVEILVAVAFGMMAFTTAKSHLLLGVAWALHAGWDTIHMAFMKSVIAPIWYPTFCIAFDVAVSVYLAHLAVLELHRRSN